MIIFEHTVPSVLIWLGVVVALSVVGYSFWRYLKPDIFTIILLVLRVLFFALLVWCLFQPQLKRSLTQIMKPRFIVALDISKSMLLTPFSNLSNRWIVAKQILDKPWTGIIDTECDIDMYTFASQLESKTDLTATDDLTADGGSTLLRDSLEKLPGRYQGQQVAGLLLLSDGIDTREASDNWAHESRPWPIYTVCIEPGQLAAAEIEPDIQVNTVNTPRRVTIGWTTELKAIISGQGTKGQAISVQLFKNDALIREAPVYIPAKGGKKEVSFRLGHPETGAYVYRIFVPPLPGESHTNDNAYAVSVRVVDTKNRLLYVEGPPRWESKYLIRMLKASSHVTPICFIRGPDKKFMTIGASGEMTADMTESELAFFKIVILGNLDAQELGRQRAMNLLKFVEDGGSLVLLGGTKAWGVSGFSQTPLKKLLPTKSHVNIPVEGKFSVALTDAGKSHRIFAGDESSWEEIPPLLSFFPDAVLSPGAESLVVANTPKGLQTVIAAQQYGQGKVIAILTDSLWRWKLSPKSNENKQYSRFWNQLISWLSPLEEHLSPQQLDMFADKEHMLVGEEIEFSAMFAGSKGNPEEDVIVNCEITTPDNRRIPFSMAKQSVITPSGKSFPGFMAKFTAQLPGQHMARALTEINGRQIKSDPVPFLVESLNPNQRQHRQI